MSHNNMNDKLTEGVDATNYYENERRMAGHTPYSQEAPPPGYGMQMMQPAMQPGPTILLVEEPPWVWNWCTIVTTVIAFFLCPLCGFTGTVFGLLAYTDHQNRNYNNGRSKKNMALCCGITGIVISAIFTILLIVLVTNGVLAAEKIARAHNGNF